MPPHARLEVLLRGILTRMVKLAKLTLPMAEVVAQVVEALFMVGKEVLLRG